jgi:hypothetical protein
MLASQCNNYTTGFLNKALRSALSALSSTADHFEWVPIDDFRFFHINAEQHTKTTPCVARNCYRCEYTDEINLGTCGTANRQRKIYLSRLPVRRSTSASLHLEEQDSNTNLPHTARINPKMNTTKQTWRCEVDRWVMDFDISDAAFSALMRIIDPGRESPTAAGLIQHSPETIASTMHYHLPDSSTMDTGHALHAGSYSSYLREDPTSALPVTTMTPFFDEPTNRPSDFSNATWHSIPDNDHTEQANALSNDESHGFSNLSLCSRSGVLRTTMKREYSQMDKDSEDDSEVERAYLPASSAVINFHKTQRYIPHLVLYKANKYASGAGRTGWRYRAHAL